MTKKYILGNILAAALGIAVLPLDAAYPEGYYDSLDGKCGEALMDAIQTLSKGHKEISYGDKTWQAFRSTDIKTVDGVDYWWDMYSTNLVAVSSGHGGMNIEHSVANSWWDGTKNAAYKDLVHLNPSDATANNRKSNYPLGEVGDVTWENGVTFVGRPSNGTGGGSSYVYEPTDEYKGDFARVFMYMFCAYKDMKWGTRFTWMYDTSDPLMFRPWAQELLLRWSGDDAVSQKERDRNDGVEKEQGNRNPFIDLPDLADHIWGAKKNEPYKVEGAGDNPDPGPGPDPDETVTYRWLAANDADGADGWDFDVREMDPAMSYVWKWDEYKGDHYLKGSAYLNDTAYPAEAYAWGPEIDMTDVEDAVFSFQHAAKFQTTLRDLCKVAVMDMTVNDEGYIKTYDVPAWPDAGSWKFTASGDIDLSEYGATNSRIRVGFLYGSTAGGADTWEIRNATLKLSRRQSSGVESVSGRVEDDSVLVEVWGNNILVPEGAVIYDLNGRQVDGENLERGIYIVVKPTFRHSVKVMVR